MPRSLLTPHRWRRPAPRWCGPLPLNWPRSASNRCRPYQRPPRPTTAAPRSQMTYLNLRSMGAGAQTATGRLLTRQTVIRRCWANFEFLCNPLVRTCRSGTRHQRVARRSLSIYTAGSAVSVTRSSYRFRTARAPGRPPRRCLRRRPCEAQWRQNRSRCAPGPTRPVLAKTPNRGRGARLRSRALRQWCCGGTGNLPAPTPREWRADR